jgi:dihydroflavonol-4-reductase
MAQDTLAHPATTKVCVTGASGFIASHIVQQLLAEGYAVRGTVRNPESDSCEHLKGLEGAPERLELVAGDLLDPAPWDAAVAGCDAVMHTASPYSLDVDDPQRELVDPALKGTRHVLEACARAGTERVVVTSSMAAITDEPDSDRVLTEGDWNEKSSVDRNPYYYSKTVAEKEAWRLAEEHELDLVVINPFLVIGPDLSPGLNTSNALFVDLLTGTYPGIMRLTWGFVDVRDVAQAHVLAMKSPDAAGRHICAAGTMPMRELVEFLGEKGYGEGRKLPSLGMDCAAGDRKSVV